MIIGKFLKLKKYKNHTLSKKCKYVKGHLTNQNFGRFRKRVHTRSRLRNDENLNVIIFEIQFQTTNKVLTDEN